MSHPQSNILMGCLGTETDPPVDVHFIPQVCAPATACWSAATASGTTSPTQELADVLAKLSAREAAEFLIDKARGRAMGGGDNLSLVVVKLEPLGS
jgi:hypothetical protein